MLQFPLKAVILLTCLIFWANALQNIEDVLLGEKFVIPPLGDENEEDNMVEDYPDDYLNGTNSLLLDNGKKANTIRETWVRVAVVEDAKKFSLWAWRNFLYLLFYWTK